MRFHIPARAAALLVSLGVLCFADCSINTIRGVWAFQGNGWVMATPPGGAPVSTFYASLGMATIDQNGNYTASGKISVGGLFQDFTFTGAFQVNPDCTATDTVSGQVVGKVMILDNGSEMRELPTVHPAGPAAGLGYMRRMSRSEWDKPACTQDMVRGSYPYTDEGWLMSPPPGQTQPILMPVASLGTFTFDRNGGGSMFFSQSIAGFNIDWQTQTLSNKVNSDCTATTEWTATSPQAPGVTITGTRMQIVLDNGNELLGLPTNVGGMFVGNAKRVSK